MHHPTDRIAHTTAFVTPVVAHWPSAGSKTYLSTFREQHGHSLSCVFNTNVLLLLNTFLLLDILVSEIVL